MISTAVGGPCTTMELVMLSATRRVRPIRRDSGAVLTSGAERELPREPEEPPELLPPNDPQPLEPPHFSVSPPSPAARPPASRPRQMGIRPRCSRP